MITLTLQRVAEEGDATFGELRRWDRSVLCLTLEELWVDKNKDGLGDTDVSRIPAGTYRCVRRVSPKRGYEVFWVEGVPGRKDVQMHKGNDTDDTLGCILLGMERGHLDGKPAVLESGVAFAKLMSELAVEEFSLVVRDIAPVGA